MFDNVLDIKTKRVITAGSLVILGVAQLPLIGSKVGEVLAFMLGPVSLGMIIGAVGAVSGLLLIKKEM